MIETHFVYQHLELSDQMIKEPLYWGNLEGWGPFSSATVFTEEELRVTRPPLGRCVQVPVRIEPVGIAT